MLIMGIIEEDSDKKITNSLGVVLLNLLCIVFVILAIIMLYTKPQYFNAVNSLLLFFLLQLYQVVFRYIEINFIK